jgi:hypothetical protein
LTTNRPHPPQPVISLFPPIAEFRSSILAEFRSCQIPLSVLMVAIVVVLVVVVVVVVVSCSCLVAWWCGWGSRDR